MWVFWMSFMVTLCSGVYTFLIYDMYKRDSGFGVLGDGLLVFSGFLIFLCLFSYFLVWVSWYFRAVFLWYVNQRRKGKGLTPLCRFQMRYGK